MALAITSNQKTVFVVNRDDSNIVNFAIGTDGKLYSEKTVTVAGSFPTALAISGDSKFLYVAFTYQPGYTTANPGPGWREVFPLTTDSNGPGLAWAHPSPTARSTISRSALRRWASPSPAMSRTRIVTAINGSTARTCFVLQLCVRHRSGRQDDEQSARLQVVT